MFQPIVIILGGAKTQDGVMVPLQNIVWGTCFAQVEALKWQNHCKGKGNRCLFWFVSVCVKVKVSCHFLCVGCSEGLLFHTAKEILETVSHRKY